MPHPLRLELLRRAREGYRQHGRGYIVLRHDRDFPYYSAGGELELLLTDNEPEAGALLKVAETTVASYVPRLEAVVVNSTPEGVFILVISPSEVSGIGEIIFSKRR